MEWVLLIIITAFILWRFRPANVNTISTVELKKILNDSDKVFIDVRTPAEFKANHIPRFHNLPLGSDFSKLPKDKEIVVICQSGMRSSQACKQLKKLGYERVTNVRGGMNAWKN